MKKFFYLFTVCCLLANTTLFAQNIFFNEIEYSIDDSSSSTDGVGLFGPTDTDLNGYEIRVYDNSGTEIQVIPLSGIIEADLPVTDRGEIWVDIPVLNASNGGQGVVLINPSGLSEQFINFGLVNQTITATVGGTALTSQYIGSHGSGKSLQVVGTGCSFPSFSAGAGNVYINTQDPSHGELNENQVVDCPEGDIDGSLLPVELLSFKGKLLSKKEIYLTWITASEINNYATALQHSTDGRTYSTIHTEYGTGDKTMNSSYEYTDLSFATGKNYYRLQQTDLDGTVRFPGEVITVDVSIRTETLTAYPNPATDYIQINFVTSQSRNTQIDIYNSLGQRVRTAFLANESLSQRIDLNGLEKGMYVIRIANLSTVIQKL